MSERTKEKAPGLRKAEIAASWCLRVGTLLSIALILSGVGLVVVGHPEWLHDPEAFSRLVGHGTSSTHSFASIVDGLARLQAPALIELGVICLIVTPVLRVVVSAIAFARARDFVFAGLAVGVLVLLAAAFAVGAAG